MLVLTGGDPFKRPDIFELVEHGVQRGLHVSITPSATALVTRSAIDRLRDAGISRIAISIDGADAATHDGTRGVKGSFDRSLEILADIRQAGIPAQVNTTLTPRNLPQIDLMATMFARQKIAMWSVFFLVPVGRASHMDRLSADAYEKAFVSLWQHAQEQPLLIKTTKAPHYRRFLIQNQIRKSQQAAGGQNPHFMSAGVNDGKGIMFVSHTGTVHPSGFLPMVCGVYPLQSVVQIYQKSPIFKSLRDANHLEGKCRACEFRHVCGGSRARAWATTGNLFAEEPDCGVPAARFFESHLN